MLTDLLNQRTGTFVSFFFIHIFVVYLVVFALYVLIINQGDIISSYHTDMNNFA